MAKNVTSLTLTLCLILFASLLIAQPNQSRVGTSDDTRAAIYNNGPCIDRAPDGTVMCIWGTKANHNNSILWTTYDDLFETWNPAQVLAEGTPDRNTPSLVADDNNHFHATWSNNFRIYYSQYDGVQWSTPVMVQKDTLNANKNSIVIDSNGYIWITYSTYYQADDINEELFIAHSTDNGVTWSDPDTIGANVVPGIVTSSFSVPHLAAGPNGKVGVTFREKDTDVSARFQLYFQEYDGNQ
ncbi:MAG TPA: exo-alpha-sialidase [bacterium]|nr:exo-alpha-sialidase [bacterium]